MIGTRSARSRTRRKVSSPSAVAEVQVEEDHVQAARLQPIDGLGERLGASQGEPARGEVPERVGQQLGVGGIVLDQEQADRAGVVAYHRGSSSRDREGEARGLGPSPSATAIPTAIRPASQTR